MFNTSTKHGKPYDQSAVIPNNIPQFGNHSAPNVTLNAINKDNIFQQSPEMLQKLLSGTPQIQPQSQVQTQLQPQPQLQSLKPKTNPSTSLAEPVNMQETQKLNTFLSSLGFKLGNTPPEVDDNVPGGRPLTLVCRAKEGVYLVNDKEKDYLSDKSKLIYEDATVTLFNSDGSLLGFASQNVVGVYILAEKRTLIHDLPNVIALNFSPKQRFLVTIDRRENKFFLTIFEANPFRKLYEFETVRYKKETWPQLKFTENEELAFWAGKPTQIVVLNPRQNFHMVRTIETKQFDFFAISNKIEDLLVICVSLEHGAGYDGHEGRIDIYKYSDLDKDKTPMVSKIIDKAHEVNLFFSPTGQNVLIWAQTFTDRTGQSYYGEHMLLYLDVNKKTLKRVPTLKGPIHDVAWNPNGGFMPAGSVLYDNLCVPKFEFGQHHRNTIRWSPLSRFVCLAGFGNLPGDMEIWDVYSLKQVGSCKSNTAVSCRWAPDGRRILTGVLNPRLRVSNNYKIFKYTGELLNCVDYSQSELYEVIWKPEKFQDRPVSPSKLSEKAESEKSEKSETGSESGDKPEEEKKIFRPKGGGAFAAQLKAVRSAKTGGRHLTPEEIFGNEDNIEGNGEKKAEDGEKDKEKTEEEEAARLKSKIFRRNDKKAPEGNKDEDNTKLEADLKNNIE